MAVATSMETKMAPVGLADLAQARRRFARWNLGFDRYIGYLLPLLFIVAIVPILDMVYWLGAEALPTMTWATLTTGGPTQPLGLFPAIAGTVWIMVIALALAVTLGLFGGIATAEFLSERSAAWVRMTANTLAGMPAIIIGMMGFVVFVLYFGWGLVLIAGAVTTAFFMTPYVFRAADLAFSSVPRTIREAALGAGARPIDYILRVARPIVTPQILNGIFLALGLGIGETATVIVTVQPSALAPTGPFSYASYLTYVIYAEYTSPLPADVTLAFQAAFLLLMIVIVINIIVRIVAWRYQTRLAGLFV
ncbi:MAG TPA: ABC transporter permease subunit [Thermoplasmata archaeon]|nr:ABC transporter permease subunit [Thermoplasmata archaeon]